MKMKMKLCTFVSKGVEKVGAYQGDRIVDLREARRLQLLSQRVSAKKAAERASQDIPDSMLHFIIGGQRTLSVAKKSEEFATNSKKGTKAVYPLSKTKLKAPLPNPPAIINMGNAYRPDPIKGFTFKPITGLIGPDEPIIIPKNISEFGAVFEVEIAIVIGKKARLVPNDDSAYDYIYGYTIYNDITDYGRQMDGGQRLQESKLFDTFCPMGPCIATKDEIEDVYNLSLKSWSNNHLGTNRNTREILRKIPEFVSVPSQIMTLLPGTIISIGAANSGRLMPGERFELEISGIGKFRNPVITEK